LNDVMPSGKFLLADLGPLKIGRPENWEVTAPQQKGQYLTIAPRAGVVSNGVGYGVMINGVSPKDQKATIDQITDEIVSALQGSSGDLKPVGEARSVQVAGVSGRTVDMQSTSPFPDAKGQSQKERDRLVTVPRPDGSVIFMVFVAPESDYALLDPTFQRMIESIQ